jgi:hypothetical protein
MNVHSQDLQRVSTPARYPNLDDAAPNAGSAIRPPVRRNSASIRAGDRRSSPGADEADDRNAKPIKDKVGRADQVASTDDCPFADPIMNERLACHEWIVRNPLFPGTFLTQDRGSMIQR